MKKNIRIILPSFLLLVFTMGLTLVYAAFNSSMTINGVAMVQSTEIAITSTKYKSSSGITDYSTPTHTKNTVTYPVELAAGASISFDLNIFNNAKEEYELTNILFTDTSLKMSYSKGCFLADVFETNETSSCVVTLTNNTEYFLRDSVTTTFEFEPYTDQSLNHKVELLATGISRGLITDMADDRDRTNHQITYIGTDPNNYVMLNGQLFRMIGLDMQVDDGTGNIEPRIKLITDTAIPNKYSYSRVDSNKNNSAGVADFAESELQIMLNTGYFNSTTSACYTAQSNTEYSCSFENNGLGGTDLVGNTLWHYGAHSDSGGTPLDLYESLYGTRSYTAGGCGVILQSTRRYCSYQGTAGTTYTTKVGLMAPSDFGFSTSGSASTSRDTCLSTSMGDDRWNGGDCASNSWLKDTTNAHWVIQPAIKTYSYARMFDLKGGLENADAVKVYKVKPTVYLNSNVLVYAGNGTRNNPYIIDLNGQQGIYNVEFDPNGGEGFMPTQVFSAGKQKKIRANSFTYARHTFLGWSTNPSATRPDYVDEALISVSENMTLYAIWAKDDILYDRVANLSRGTSISGFRYGTSDLGVYEYDGLDSDGGDQTIYYYRGDVKDNNVLFANLCWKILRTTSSGGVKLLYNGTYDSSTGCSGNANGIAPVKYNDFNTIESAGYMYTMGMLNGYATDSIIKNEVQKFFIANLAGYSAYLEDVPFCNNRSILDDSGNILQLSSTSEVDLTKDINFSHSRITTPSLACDSLSNNFNVGYSVTRASQGNNALTLPIGLPTADELVYAGSNNDTKDKNSDPVDHTNNYIYSGYAYWTMTPRYLQKTKDDFVRIWRVASDGSIGSLDARTESIYFRPVISLNSEIAIESGTGTATDPIRVKEPSNIEYGLTYYANGGTGQMQYKFVPKNTEITLDANQFTYEGHHFIGWATTSNNKVVYRDRENVTITKDTMLYAVWERDSVNFDFTGTVQTYEIPTDGYYLLETWGAQGGNFNDEYQGGYGAYSSGAIYLPEGSELYVVVGGQGDVGSTTTTGFVPGGYNGGGYGYMFHADVFTAGGGGATHISGLNGLLSEQIDNKTAPMVVAAGGTGAYHYGDRFWSGASGGGFKGGYISTDGNAGTQESGFAFGKGGLGSTSDSHGDVNQSGGGGGYYGGRSAYADYVSGPGGGSSYINPGLVSTTNHIPHMSALINNRTNMLEQYYLETSDNPATRTITAYGVSPIPTSDYAKQGNGYAKITFLGERIE